MTRSLISGATVLLLAMILLVSCTGVTRKGCVNCGERFSVSPIGGVVPGAGGGGSP